MAGVPPTRSSALPGVQPALTQAPTAAQLKVAALEARRRELAAKRAKLQARNDLRDEVGDGFESLHMRSLRRMAQDRAQVAKERAKWVDNLLAGMKLRRAAMSEPRTNGSGGGNEDSPAAATVPAMGKATRAQLELERTKVRASCCATATCPSSVVLPLLPVRATRGTLCASSAAFVSRTGTQVTGALATCRGGAGCSMHCGTEGPAGSCAEAAG